MNKDLKDVKLLKQVVNSSIFFILLFPIFSDANSNCTRQWQRTQKRLEKVKKIEICGHKEISNLECQQVLGVGPKTAVAGGVAAAAASASFVYRKFDSLKPRKPMAPRCKIGNNFRINLFPKAHASCTPKKAFDRQNRLNLLSDAKFALQRENNFIDNRGKTQKAIKEVLENSTEHWSRIISNAPLGEPGRKITEDGLKDFVRQYFIFGENNPRSMITEGAVEDLDKKYPGFKKTLDWYKDLAPEKFSVIRDRKAKVMVRAAEDFQARMRALKEANDTSLRALKAVDIDKVVEPQDLFRTIMSSVSQQGEIFDYDSTKDYFKNGMPTEKALKELPKDQLDLLQLRRDNVNKLISAGDEIEIEGRKGYFKNLFKLGQQGDKDKIVTGALLKLGTKLGAVTASVVAFPIGAVFAAASTAGDIYEVANFLKNNVNFCKKRYKVDYVVQQNNCKPRFVMDKFISLSPQDQFELLSDSVACEFFEAAYDKYLNRGDWELDCPIEGSNTTAKLVNLKDSKQKLEVSLNSNGVIQSVGLYQKKNQAKPHVIGFADSAGISSFKVFHSPGVYGIQKYIDVIKPGLNRKLSRSSQKTLDYYFDTRALTTEASYCCLSPRDYNQENCDRFASKYGPAKPESRGNDGSVGAQ